MSEQINKLNEILNEVDDKLELEDYKTKLLEIKELFKPKQEDIKTLKEQPNNQRRASELSTRSDQNNSDIENILNSKRVKLSLIYNNYQYKLITKKQKEEIRDLLVNNKYIKIIKSKNNKILGYELNEDKKEDFKKWLIDNLISIN